MSQNKYLEKIAADEKPKKMTAGAQALAGLGSAFGGAVIAQNIVHPVRMPVVKKVMNYIESPHEHANLGTIKKMLRDNKMDVSMNHRAHYVNKHLSGGLASIYKPFVSGGKGPVFIPGKSLGPGNRNFVGGVKTPDYDTMKYNGGRFTMRNKIVNKDVVMHELGHAKDFSRFGKAKVAVGIGGGLATKVAPLLLASDKTKDYAVPVAAAGVLPMLRNEAVANYHAYKGIKAHRGAEAAKSFAKKLLPSQMGAYGLAAAGTVGSVYAGKKILDHIHKKRNGQ